MIPLVYLNACSCFVLQSCGGKISEGLLVGALLSMSSSSVVHFQFSFL